MREVLNIKPEGIVNHIIKICAENKIFDITNMKIQKLLYYVYAEFYRKNDTLLFDLEEIEFWKHGPVVRSVYDALKHFKDNAVDRYIEDFANRQEEENFQGFKPVLIDNDNYVDSVVEIVKRVVGEVGEYSAMKLRNLSHKSNGVWFSITENGTELHNKRMNNELVHIMKQEADSIFKIYD